MTSAPSNVAPGSQSRGASAEKVTAPLRGSSAEKATPPGLEITAEKEKSRKEQKKELEKRYPKKGLSASVSSEERSTQLDRQKRRKIGQLAAARTQLVQISCEEVGRVNRPIEDEPYYHGFMTRAEADKLLRREGEFLVRKTDVAGETHYILSMVKSGELHNFLIKRTNKKRLYWVFNYAFKTVGDLVQHHYRNREPISADGFLLVKPCLKKEWQLNHEQVERHKKLGEGNFGEVWAGTLQVSPFLPKKNVAIKTLHKRCLEGDERIKFLKEANLMLELNHPNVIRLYGVATAKEPIMIVTELAEGGDLEKKVRDTESPLTLEEKLNFVFGGAKGMAYLEKKQIIHRDIAARNCLLGADNELKISDFGLSLLGSEAKERSLQNKPIRWMAPETLRRGRYSSKSDVYSFGVLIYEIYSWAREPFEDVEDARVLVKMKITNKALLQVLGEIQPELEVIRQKCLLFEPEDRPSFEQLEAMIRELPGVRLPPPPTLLSRLMVQIRRIFGRQE